MHLPLIKKPPTDDDVRRRAGEFSWAAAAAELAGLPDGRGLNLAFEAVDRHARGATADRLALRHVAETGTVTDLSFAELRAATSRFADALHRLGVGPGEAVFTLAGRIPELYTAALGAVRLGAVFCPLFSAFGPEPVRARLELGAARVLVTTARLYERKVAPIRDRLPRLEHVLIVGDRAPEGTRLLAPLLAAADPERPAAPTAADDPALLFFTSGTTGLPKGALHVHEAAVVQRYTARVALGLRAGDRYWCTADPGWVTGTVYGIFAPLLAGATLVVDEGEFDGHRWLGLLQDQQIAVWYTSPTAARMLMRLGAEAVATHDLGHLRHVACVGEALDAEAVHWSREVLGQPLHDTWWQTETGGIMIANLPTDDIKPGSMGRPLPGVEAAVVTIDEAGLPHEVVEPAATGQLALRAGWPSMFRTYLGDEARYRQCFAGGYYLTGDVVKRDADGYFWFRGRSDDMIKSAGHLIGPNEVEACLAEHAAVADAAVIGVPDQLTGEKVKAFVVPAPGRAPDDALRRELLAHARRELGPAVAPRDLAFCESLPRNRAGKRLRRLLKARELGTAAGDLSTLLPTEPSED